MLIVTWRQTMASETEHFCFESTVRGHHVYKRIWTPLIGELLQTVTETGNGHDKFAVAVKKDDDVVGHVPREISKVAWLFIQHGGEVTCEITSRRQRSGVLCLAPTHFLEVQRWSGDLWRSWLSHLLLQLSSSYDILVRYFWETIPVLRIVSITTQHPINGKKFTPWNI